MAINLETLQATLRLQADQFRAGMAQARQDLSGLKKTFADVGKQTTAIGKRLTLGVTLPIVAATGAAVKFASDQAESVNKVNEVFGDNAKVITDWSKDSAQSFGLSRAEALEATGTLGNLFKGVGIANDELPTFSQNIVQTAADLGSFNNADPRQVLEDLRSGLVGEAEPLRKYGILLNEATVKQKAMELGLVGANGELTEAAKVQARYALILEQTGDAQGDFARTSDGLANKSRILRAQLKDLAAQFGEILLPFVTKLANALGTLLSFFQRLPTPVRVAIFFLAGLAAVIGPLLIVIGSIASGVAALLPIFAALGPALLPLLGPLALVAAALAALVIAWQFNLFGVRDRLSEFVRDVIGVFNRLTGEGVDPINAAIRAFGSALEDLTGIEMSDFFFNLAQAVDGAVLLIRIAAALIGQIVDAISLSFDLAVVAIHAGLSEGIDLLERFTGALMAVGLTVLGWALAVIFAFQLVRMTIQNFFNDIANVVAVGTGLTQAGVGLAQGVIDGWTTRIALFALTLANLGNWAALTVGVVATSLYDKGIDLMEGVRIGWDDRDDLFALTLGALGVWAALKVGVVAASLYDKGVDLVQGVIDGWVEAAKRLALTLSGLGTWAAGKVGNLFDDLYPAGVSLVEGLAAGIFAAIPGLQSAVNEINGVINGIIDFIDPRSPSHLMQPVGESMPWGLAVGIRRRMGLLNRAVGGMSAAIGVAGGGPLPTVNAVRASTAVTGAGGRFGGDFYNYGTITVRANNPGEFMDALRAHDVGGARP